MQDEQILKIEVVKCLYYIPDIKKICVPTMCMNKLMYFSCLFFSFAVLREAILHTGVLITHFSV